MKSFNSAQIERKSVLGIGNALIDVLINIADDSVLQKFGLPKGSMTLVDANISAAQHTRLRSCILLIRRSTLMPLRMDLAAFNN